MFPFMEYIGIQAASSWNYEKPTSFLNLPIWVWPIWGAIQVGYIGLYNIVKGKDFFEVLLNLHK